MNLVLETNDLEVYLRSSEIIDYNHQSIMEICRLFSQETENEIEKIKAVYHFVRDRVDHAVDIKAQVVTCRASDVLKHKQGICYAKAHLLAAILRSLGIPAGFCYQKLILEDEQKPWIVLHGLNAVYIKSLNKWIRLDARGNKEGVNAEFSIEAEKLAFPVREELGEQDGFVIYANPNKKLVQLLENSKTVEELLDNKLPFAL